MNKLDLDYKNATIIEVYPVEDSMNTLVRCLDARQKDGNLNTFDIRNSKSAEIHACIMMTIQLDRTINDTLNMVDDIKEVREDDTEGSYGLDDNRPKQSDVEELQQQRDWYEQQALGLMSLLWVNFGVTHTSCLLYISPQSKYGRSAKQMKIMKQSMTQEYFKFFEMAHDNMPQELDGFRNTFQEERQAYGYHVTGNVEKLANAAKPVEQADLFTKVAYEKMDQARSTLDNIEKELDKGSIVAKEKVYQNGKAFVVKQ